MEIGKKGVSAVIASVLLILIVMILASVIFSFARGFIGERTEDNSLPIPQLCEAMDFSVVVIEVVFETVKLEVVNRGNTGIKGFEFKVHHDDGSSEIVNSSAPVLAGAASAFSVTFSGVDFSNIEEVEVFPVLNVTSSKPAVCYNDPVYLKL